MCEGGPCFHQAAEIMAYAMALDLYLKAVTMSPHKQPITYLFLPASCIFLASLGNGYSFVLGISASSTLLPSHQILPACFKGSYNQVNCS